jgi:nitrite reductase (NADH) small subunit
VAALADLDTVSGSGLGVAANGVPMALFSDGGEVRAVQATCPHRGGELAGGLARAGRVICPLHAWQFRLADGCNLDGGPGLTTYPARIEAGRILVQA